MEYLIQEGKPQFYIAEKLGRSKSTISRELRRNKNKDVRYSAEAAETAKNERCKRETFRSFTDLSKSIIEEKLMIHWTPEQISAELKNKHNIHASHELIYQYLAFDRQKGGTLYMYLPHRGKKYKKRNLKTRNKIWNKAKKRKSIDDRPAIVNENIEIGHWEGDTVESKGHQGGIGTFVDRKSKFLIIRRVKNKTSMAMKNAMVGAFKVYPRIVKTMTLDNGTEFALHDEIEKELQTKVYFTHPYSPWERGLNENTNGLIRRFFPKGTDFSKITNIELLSIQNLINERPRKSLNYKTPKEVLCKELLLTNVMFNIMETTSKAV